MFQKDILRVFIFLKYHVCKVELTDIRLVYDHDGNILSRKLFTATLQCLDIMSYVTVV